YQSGDEKTALDSLVKLFETIRTLLCKHKRACSHFATLSVFTLNQLIRPFTARWHERLLDGRLHLGDDRHQFRDELQELQEYLRNFVTLLGELAEGPDFQPGSESGFGQQETPATAFIDAPIPFGILFDESVANAAAIQNQEAEALVRRRQALGRDTSP